MAAETANPIVQIINGDEENVRVTVACFRRGTERRGGYQQTDADEYAERSLFKQSIWLTNHSASLRWLKMDKEEVTQMDTDKRGTACTATTGFGVRGLVRAFGRRLVAVEWKEASELSSLGR
jgi:hypothetical protein